MGVLVSLGFDKGYSVSGLKLPHSIHKRPFYFIEITQCYWGYLTLGIEAHKH